MNFEFTEMERHWQRQAESFCATIRHAPSGGDSLPSVSELYARAWEADLCGLSLEHACAFPTEGIPLFLGIEALARHEPELAFAVAYHCLCHGIASVLLQGEALCQALRHLSGPHSFNTLLVWPAGEPGTFIGGTLSQMDPQRRQLKIEDPLMPLSSADEIYFLGWAYSDPGEAVAFWIPMAFGRNWARRVGCVGLNGISFRHITWEAQLDSCVVIAPVQNLEQQRFPLEWMRTVFYGAVLSGLFQSLLSYAVSYSQTRKTFGKHILLHQAVATNLAEMKVEVETIRLALLEMMQALSQDRIDDFGVYFRQYLCDSALRVSARAVQVLGGHGLLGDHPVEKWARDVAAVRSFLF